MLFLYKDYVINNMLYAFGLYNYIDYNNKLYMAEDRISFIIIYDPFSCTIILFDGVSEGY